MLRGLEDFGELFGMKSVLPVLQRIAVAMLECVQVQVYVEVGPVKMTPVKQLDTTNLRQPSVLKPWEILSG